MSNQQHIDTGSAANNGTGDPLRTGFIKIEENFNELFYTASISTFPFTGSAQVTGSDGISTVLGVTGSIEATNDITASIVKVADKIVAGDESIGTNISFTDNSIKFTISNIDYLLLDNNDDTITVNPNNEDINFIAEGDAASDLLFVDAGNDKVGIKIDTPEKDLHVNGDLQATQYFGQIADSDPSVAGQFFQTGSEAIVAGASGFSVICVSEG